MPPFFTEQAEASPSTDYGTDVLTSPTLDTSFALYSGPLIVCHAIARRLTTPRGKLPFHPDYGKDLRAYLNEAMTSSTLSEMRAAAEMEAEADERVESASATVTFKPPEKAVTLRLVLFMAEGPFELVLGISELTAEVLSVGEA